MKHPALLSLVLVLSASAATASVVQISCVSPKGAAHSVKIFAIQANRIEDSRLTLTIDGHVGRIDSEQPSNDAVAEAMAKPSEGILAVSGDLTSDDATDVHVNVDARQGTIKLAKGASDGAGSAQFVGVISAEILRYNRKAEQSLTVAKTTLQELTCRAHWVN